MRRTPLTHSFCQHVASSGKTFAVTDSRTDARITWGTGGAAIEDIGVIAYLGVPLRGADGTVLGAVCAISDQPRMWNTRHVAALEAVAEVVATEGRLRRQAMVLHQTMRTRSAIVETALDGLIVTDVHGRMREFNPAAEAMFGYPAALLMGQDLSDWLVPPELRDAHRAGMRRFAEGAAIRVLGVPVRQTGLRADGSRFPIELTLTTTRSLPLGGVDAGTDADPAADDLLIAYVRDRSHDEAREAELAVATEEQRATALALTRSEQQLRLLVDSAPTTLFAVDVEERITLLTGGGLGTLGVDPATLLGRTVPEAFPTRDALVANVRRALAGAELEFTAEMNGRMLRTAYRPVRDDVGAVVGIVGVANDITVDVEREDSLRQLATHDQLTGLLNRRAAEDEVQRFLDGGVPAAVLAIDLDHFKDVNDSLGHATGDEFLRGVCRRIRERVPADAVLARFGGDELLLVSALPAEQPRNAAQELARTVLAAVSEPLAIDVSPTAQATTEVVELSMSASVGIVVTPSHGDELSTILARADAAMYSVKRTGRGTYAFYAPGEDTARRRLSLSGRLRKAVTGGVIQVHYQPLLDLSTGRTVAFEALSRWTDPDLGPVSPAEFVSLAEDTGLVDELTDLVLDRALAANAAWNADVLRRAGHDPASGVPAAGVSGQLLGIGVNVASRQLRDRGLAARVAAAADSHGVPAGCVVLELTEGAAMDSSLVTEAVLREVRDAGLTAVIDDFGVAYSNLARLRDLSADRLIDAVKLDRSFVAELPGSRATALVSSFLHTAATLGVNAVAEGIETPAHLAALQDLGCFLGQGWLFAPAMPGDDVLPWLRAQDPRA